MGGGSGFQDPYYRTAETRRYWKSYSQAWATDQRTDTGQRERNKVQPEPPEPPEPPE